MTLHSIFCRQTWLRLSLILFTILPVVFCHNANARTIPDILTSNQLSVGVINSPVGGNIGRTGYQGENIALAKGFADYLEVTLFIRHFYNHDELEQALQNDEIDIAAPLFTPETLNDKFATGPVFQHRPQVRLMLSEQSKPCVMASDILRDTPVETMLPKLVQQQEACVVLPEKWLQPLTPQPHLNMITLPTSDTLPHQWLIKREATLLRAALFDFTHRSRVNGSLAIALTKPAPFNDLSGPLPTRQFIADTQTHISALKTAFSYPGQTFPWHLLAAISYADHMLTTKDRNEGAGVLEPFTLPPAMATPLALTRPYTQAQLVQALDTYLAELSRKLPAKLQLPDKQMIMVAAYVLGLDHLTDAIWLTQQQGADPFLWANVKQQVALLHAPNVYQTTRHGYANGPLAVHYVEWVNHFSDTLQLLENQN
ncbi:hypothetical protein FJ444_01815 [Aestuariibacter sp. GS-14]|uniref:hypothetical protein n=1 Tax=Aestuariibacter sp. GS-14 TaxID=2590670 RepID=UPI00112D57CF|nr:hypothetical protein [Aestuariibacter sp. GS-14]TPV62028.1 hypothetical protein FJ444_01815 [Aestuariibacter sp. GS-14]